MIKCKVCGAMLDDWMLYCPDCGAKVETPNSELANDKANNISNDFDGHQMVNQANIQGGFQGNMPGVNQMMNQGNMLGMNQMMNQGNMLGMNQMMNQGNMPGVNQMMNQGNVQGMNQMMNSKALFNISSDNLDLNVDDDADESKIGIIIGIIVVIISIIIVLGINAKKRGGESKTTTTSSWDDDYVDNSKDSLESEVLDYLIEYDI